MLVKFCDCVTPSLQLVQLLLQLIDNNWVTFKKEASLEITAGVPLAGGTNKDITGTEHSDYLAKIESYSFNAMGVVTTEESIKSLYSSKFQADYLYQQSALLKM